MENDEKQPENPSSSKINRTAIDSKIDSKNNSKNDSKNNSKNDLKNSSILKPKSLNLNSSHQNDSFIIKDKKHVLLPLNGEKYIKKQKTAENSPNKLQSNQSFPIQPINLNEQAPLIDSSFDTSQKEVWRQQVLSVLQNELSCAICQEIVIECSNLACSHLFCDTCISEWLRNNSQCPVCRIKVQARTRVRSLDQMLNLFFSMCDDISSRKRLDLLEERRKKRNAEIRKEQKLRRIREIQMTRGNIRLLHMGLSNATFSVLAQQIAEGVSPANNYRLVSLQPTDQSQLPNVSTMGREFQTPLQESNSDLLIPLETEFGLVGLALEYTDQLNPPNSEQIRNYLNRVARSLDFFYRFENVSERTRRRERAVQINRLDLEETRRIRNQERQRRSQRFARRDQITQFELDNDN